jgi:flagellar basal body-associated protein FliL
MNESKKSRLLIPLLVLALGGAGFGGYVLGAQNAGAAVPPDEVEPAEGEVVEVGVLTVTLAGAGSNYARVGLAVVLAEGLGPDAVSGRLPLVKDAAISVLAGKTPDDFRTPDALARLRRQLTDIAREIYPDGEVLRVVLTEAIVG